MLLFALYVSRPRWSVWYAAVAAVGTVLGAAIGYWLHDVTLWILTTLAGDRVAGVQQWLHDHAFGAIFVGSFTPVSDELLVFASGVFRVSFGTFVIASLLGRAIRTYPAALRLRLYGGPIERWIDGYLELVSIVFVVAVTLAVVLIWLLAS